MTHLKADTLPFPSLPPATCLSASAHFEELALPLFGSIHNFAQYLSRGSHDAEDLVQETYLKALLGFDTFEPGSNLRSWMFRIMKNTFLNSLAKPLMRFHHTGLEEILENLVARSADPCKIYIQRVRLLALQSAIERLAPVYRDVLMLCDLEGASYREAAEALSIPIGTVMSRLARARKAIRESLRHEAINVTNPENN